MKIVEQSVTILNPRTRQSGINILKEIEYAGRNCYRSQDKITDTSYEKFVCNLITNVHESPLEFGDMIVEIVTGRDVLAEITRHRLCSFAVQSQRYVLEIKTGDVSFIRPNFYVNENLHMDAKAWCASRCWEQSMEDAEDNYVYLIENCGMKPEDARKVLPNSTACRIVMKANIREWRHIMELRSSAMAYPETRTMMNLLIKEAKFILPVVFDDIGEDDK